MAFDPTPVGQLIYYRWGTADPDAINARQNMYKCDICGLFAVEDSTVEHDTYHDSQGTDVEGRLADLESRATTLEADAAYAYAHITSAEATLADHESRLIAGGL
jgi:hypothetical protein